MQLPGRPLQFYIDICHHRWALPLLAELAERRGARSAELRRALGMNRETLSATLLALGKLGLVDGNPGYGHPLRPEYLLTQRGRSLAPRCAKLLAFSATLNLGDLIGRKWTLPVLIALGAAELRFSAIANALPGITPRSLAQSLKALAEDELIRRSVDEGFPPSALYSLTPRGLDLLGRIP